MNSSFPIDNLRFEFGIMHTKRYKEMFNENQEVLFSYELSKGINLFLGARFSILPNNLNETLPNAKELCEEVCTKFGVDEIFSDDLYSASEMVSESEYQAFWRKRFTVSNGCK